MQSLRSPGIPKMLKPSINTWLLPLSLMLTWISPPPIYSPMIPYIHLASPKCKPGTPIMPYAHLRSPITPFAHLSCHILTHAHLHWFHILASTQCPLYKMLDMMCFRSLYIWWWLFNSVAWMQHPHLYLSNVLISNEREVFHPFRAMRSLLLVIMT